MSIRKRSSVNDIIDEGVQEMEQWLDQFEESQKERPSWNRAECSISPLKNIRIMPKDVVVILDLPFTREDTLNVESIDRNTIDISAAMKRVVHLHELGIGQYEAEIKKFHCRTRVPVPVDMEKMKISFKNGILKIHIPRQSKLKVKPNRKTRN